MHALLAATSSIPRRGARGGPRPQIVRRDRNLPASSVRHAGSYQAFAQPDICDIGDRYYSYDYKLLARLQAQGSDFVVRLRLDTRWVEENSELLAATDRAAGVTWREPCGWARRARGRACASSSCRAKRRVS